MDLYAVASAYSPKRALSLAHLELPANAVLCGKLIAISWLLTGQVIYHRAEPVAFGGFTPAFAHPALFAQLVLLAQLFAIMTIVCSAFFRVGCAALGGLIAALCLLDQALFSNNRAFCAALLIMLTLGARGTFARAQVALVYGCAAVDKLLSVDWRSGLFLRTFASELCRVGELWSPGWSPGGALPVTCALAQRMAASASFAVLCSALIIGCELALACGYAAGARGTAPLALCFHGLLLTVTGSTFGVFFHAGVACSVLLLSLERQPAPFDRAWPYFALAAVFAGPWLRPWFGAGLMLVPVSWWLRGRPLRTHVTD